MASVIPIHRVEDRTEADLLRDGWRKRTTLGEPRLTEVVEGYRSLGYEVYVREFRTQGGCTTCFDAGQEMGQVYGTIYVRQRAGDRRDDELF